MYISLYIIYIYLSKVTSPKCSLTANIVLIVICCSLYVPMLSIWVQAVWYPIYFATGNYGFYYDASLSGKVTNKPLTEKLNLFRLIPTMNRSKPKQVDLLDAPLS